MIVGPFAFLWIFVLIRSKDPHTLSDVSLNFNVDSWDHCPPNYVAFVLMYHGFHLLTADEMKPKTNFDKRVYLAFTKKFKSLQEDSFLWWWW